jgi:hypothetical protein
MTQKILFSGSRAATPDMLAATDLYIRDRLAGKDVCIIVGDAEGIDYRVIQTCDELELPIEVHGGYGKMRCKTWTGVNVTHDTDYLERDRIMANLIGPDDRAVIVWDGISKRCGTVATARAVSKNTLLVYWLWTKWE